MKAENNMMNRAGVGYAESAVAPDQSPSQVRDAIGMTEEQIAALHSALSHLESRLDTILSPQDPRAADGVTGKPAPTRSHLTERLGHVNQTLIEAVGRVRELTQRVEL